jgi:hypothetical protein
VKICFHVLNAYSLFDSSSGHIFGGAELRASLFAKELAKDTKYKVDFITLNHGQRKKQTLEGVNVIADQYYADENFRPAAKNYFTRFAHKLKTLFGISNNPRTESLRKSDADLYILFGISGLNRRVVEFCLQNSKRLALFFASDEELNLSDGNFLNLNKDLISGTVNAANLIFCQNQFQMRQLEQLFQKKGILLLNPININVEYLDKSNDSNKKIIWIGKSNHVKDPLMLVDLAKANPDKQFVMFCNNSDKMLHHEVKKELPDNVLFFDNANNEEVEKRLALSHILVSTSVKEGFANVFLMAGKYSLPVITTMVDPNDYIKTNKCGLVCERENSRLNEAVNELYNNKKYYKELAFNHYSYVKNNHASKNIITKFKSVIESHAN